MAEGDMVAGIAGLPMDGDFFELGKGITIRRTYAHLMLPYVVAFKRAEPGKAHPGPWKSAEQGKGFDIEAELFVPKDIDGAEPWEIGRTIAFLLRLGVTPSATIPLLASHPFEKVAKLPDREGRLLTLEVRQRAFVLSAEDAKLTEKNAKWLAERWERTLKLSKTHAEFDLAITAMDTGQFERNTSFTLLALWAALEALFCHDRNELKMRVSSFIASYIEPYGAKRGQLRKRVGQLYDKRSAAAHGIPNHKPDDVFDLFSLMRLILMKIVEEGKIPTRERLETALYGE